MFIIKKKWLWFFTLVIFLDDAIGQKISKDPYNHAVCNTTVHDSGYYMPNAAAFLASVAAKQPDAVSFSSPYYVRIFIRIVREDNGTLPGCTVQEALQNFDEMNGQYAGHNICFQLMGIDFVDDSYLNNFNVSANLALIYPAYIKSNNLDVDSAVTIFIHYNFLNNNSSSGNAYGVPNNFMSIARWAVTSTNVHSIFGHEMGHCLGLYHTFEKVNSVQESVTRNSGNSCYNCDSDGDLCCDTPADYPNSEDYTSSTTCIYSRVFLNTCDSLQYSPSTTNIMSYQPWACIPFGSSAITANQHTRMHATILNPLAPIFTRVAENSVALGSISASSNAVRVYSAKNSLTTAGNATISHTGSSQAYFAAGGSITFSPGVSFTPGSNGLAQASISGCN